MGIPINYPAVVVAAIVNYAIGALWYALLFRKSWQRLQGLSEMKLSPTSIIAAIVGALLMSFVLDHALIFASAYMKVGGAAGGLEIGFANWIGFIAPVTLGTVIYEKKSWALWALNNGYWLVSLLVMGLILALWT